MFWLVFSPAQLPINMTYLIAHILASKINPLFGQKPGTLEGQWGPARSAKYPCCAFDRRNILSIQFLPSASFSLLAHPQIQTHTHTPSRGNPLTLHGNLVLAHLSLLVRDASNIHCGLCLPVTPPPAGPEAAWGPQNWSSSRG